MLTGDHEVVAQRLSAAAIACDARHRDDGRGDQGEQPYDDDDDRDSCALGEGFPMSPRGLDVAESLVQFPVNAEPGAMSIGVGLH